MAVGNSGYELEGLKEAQRKMEKAIQGIVNKSERAIQDVCLDLLNESKQLAPLDTGELRASGYTEFADLPEGYVGEVGFGTPYAAVQHEELEYEHEHGQAKYLEQPLKKNADKYAKQIADKSKIGGGS